MTICIFPDCTRGSHARRLCRTHYNQWHVGTDLGIRVPEAWEDEGPGVCICPVSFPNPKCCTLCRFPCVHRMAPHIADHALAKMPRLADQVLWPASRPRDLARVS